MFYFIFRLYADMCSKNHLNVRERIAFRIENAISRIFDENYLGLMNFFYKMKNIEG